MPDIKYGQGNFTGNRKNTDSNMQDKTKQLLKDLDESNSTELKRLIEANGIANGHSNSRLYNKFSRIPVIDPYNTTSVTKEYIFFTKPDLHIFNASSVNLWSTLQNYSFFVDAADRYEHVCQQLELSAGGGNNSPFMNLLSNTIRSGIDTPSLEAENGLETGGNVYGTKISYRGNSYTSDQDLTFSAEFEDTKFYEVYMLFKIYDEYCKLKNLGLLEVTDGYSGTWLNYTLNKILHDQFAVYKFVVGEDGMTIVWFGKYTGVYPTGAPRDSFSDMNKTEVQKITVNFKAQFFRDMDPSIISEFNYLVANSGLSMGSRLGLWDQTMHRFNPDWAGAPYIITTNDGVSHIAKMGKYKLIWYA